MKLFLAIGIKYLCLVLCAGYLIQPFCLKQTEGFATSHLQAPLSEHEKSPCADKICLEITDQPFYYLGRGGQSFAFVSEDGQYVIKCIKSHIKWPHYQLLKFFPMSKQLTRRIKKRERDFNSYRLAFDRLKEESGLLYVHLGQTDHLKTKITLIDKLHIAHEVELDQIDFILQKKATLLYDYIEEKMEMGRDDLARQAIESTLKLIHTRQAKGIFDEDPKLHANIGIWGSQAMFIDVGRFKESTQKEDLSLITARFNAWLELHYPELL